MAEKTICFFNSTKKWGGGEKWHFDMATRLHEQGFKVFVITNKNSELYERIKKTDIKHHGIHVSNLSFLNVFKILRIRAILRKQRVYTIILNLSSDVKVAGIAAKKAKVKNIIYRRGSAIPIRNTFLNRYLFSSVITHVLANSVETKRTINMRFHKLFPEDKISVIYNGIDLKEYDDSKVDLLYERHSNEIILGNAGRLVEQKGHFHLLDIADKLRNKGLSFKLLIAGEGKLLEELEVYANELGFSQEIEFVGFVENIKSLMESVDIFLLTSKWEGFGYVIVEAMASSKPVVAFDNSSNPEIIKDNETGYLARAFNCDEFADKVKQIATNKEISSKMAIHARKRVEEMFAIDITLKNLKKLLTSIGH